MKSNRIAIAFTLVAAASAAMAQSREIKFTSTNLGMGVAINFEGKAMNVFAGKLQFQDTETKVKFLSVCGDLYNMITVGQTYKVVPELSSTQNSNRKGAGSIVANAFNLANSNDEAAALQVAVWEAVYDAGKNGGTTPNFDGGSFRATLNQNVKAKAVAYYDYINKGGVSTYWNPDPTCAGQGQYAPVPEPATIAALGMGAAAVIRRKRRSTR